MSFTHIQLSIINRELIIGCVGVKKEQKTWCFFVKHSMEVA